MSVAVDQHDALISGIWGILGAVMMDKVSVQIGEIKSRVQVPSTLLHEAMRLF